MNKYDEMSDFEINYLVAKIATDGEVIGKADMWPTNNGNAVQIIYKVGISGEYKDYCNNPADMWPIIVDNSITINYDTCQAHVSSYFNESIKISVSKNMALRAAATVFLMMKDSTK
jgi:hypothetical protein